jgi:large subunit ribosomal protein L10
MDQPRPEKVAVVDEVRERLSSSKAVLLTEYRGINVSGMATLRRALREAGGDYKVYKNTLVRIASRELGHEIDEMLTGPTAIAFVPDEEGVDPAVVAKALKAFGKDNPALVMKGGLLGDRVLSADDIKALADVAPREELLARLAGGLAAPMQQFASALQALPRNLAYGLAALIEKGGAPGAPAPVAEAPVAEAPAEEAPVAEAPADEAPATDAPATDAPATDESPADEASAADASADEAPAEEASAADAPADEAPAEEAPAADASTEATPESAAAGDETETPSASAESTEPEQES